MTPMGIDKSQKVWLITGASQGLGLALAIEAIRAGHKVLATARNLEKARAEHPEVEAGGGAWIKLDVVQADTQARVDAAIREHGGERVDVVVNNAGHALIGTVEDISDEEMLSSFKTMFMGPHRVIKACLPFMRAQKSGVLAYHSSCLSLRPCPGAAAYSTAKAASDLLHEVLRLELRTFNIRTLIINSGQFLSNLLTNGPQTKAGIKEDYLGEGTAIAEIMPYLASSNTDPLSTMRGDPKKWAARVREVIDGEGRYGSKLSHVTRVMLGPDTIILADQQAERLKREIEDSREIAASTDYEGTSAVGTAYLATVLP